jgi:hypothetical protein
MQARCRTRYHGLRPDRLWWRYLLEGVEHETTVRCPRTKINVDGTVATARRDGSLATNTAQCSGLRSGPMGFCQFCQPTATTPNQAQSLANVVLSFCRRK